MDIEHGAELLDDLAGGLVHLPGHERPLRMPEVEPDGQADLVRRHGRAREPVDELESFDERLVARGFRILAVGDELGRCAFTTLNVRRGYSRTPEWSAFRSALSVAMTRLADTAGRSRELPALVDGTRGAVRTPPHVIYDAVVDLQAVGRLIAFMRAEGIPAPGDASEHVERGVAIRALERLPGGRSRDLA